MVIHRVPSSARWADALVVYIHWGYAGTFLPSRFQAAILHLLIDKGVDILLGSHPHVIQPVELYRGKLIVYSMSNFLFDMWRSVHRKCLLSPRTRGLSSAGSVFRAHTGRAGTWKHLMSL
jgi:hypothetical protein